MPECPFCQLATHDAGDAPAHRLHEDASFIVILDRQSLGWGHCMVIPKRHVPEVHKLPEAEYLALFRLARRLAPCLKQATGARAVGYMAFGSGLRQAHLHLVPHDDPMVLAEPLRHVQDLSEPELAANAARLRPFLAQVAQPSSNEWGQREGA